MLTFTKGGGGLRVRASAIEVTSARCLRFGIPRHLRP